MQHMFENVTKMALEEIVLKHAKEGKFGYLLTNESFAEMIEHLNEFFMASRAMKSRGDQVMHGAKSATSATSASFVQSRPQKRPFAK